LKDCVAGKKGEMAQEIKVVVVLWAELAQYPRATWVMDRPLLGSGSRSARCVNHRDVAMALCASAGHAHCSSSSVKVAATKGV